MEHEAIGFGTGRHYVRTSVLVGYGVVQPGVSRPVPRIISRDISRPHSRAAGADHCPMTVSYELITASLPGTPYPDIRDSRFFTEFHSDE
jgi:hypothetical protein